MKKYFIKSTSILFIILTIIITAVPFASAATLLDESKKVSVTMNCTKPGYSFELFRVADLTTTSGTANETAYTPLFDSIASEVNYTDVSVGDTVEYALYNTVAGSTSNKLEQYTVKDKMSKGLTFNKDSVKVYLADSSKAKLADLTKDTDYKLNVTSEGTGKDGNVVSVGIFDSVRMSLSKSSLTGKSISADFPS